MMVSLSCPEKTLSTDASALDAMANESVVMEMRMMTMLMVVTVRLYETLADDELQLMRRSVARCLVDRRKVTSSRVFSTVTMVIGAKYMVM